MRWWEDTCERCLHLREQASPHGILVCPRGEGVRDTLINVLKPSKQALLVHNLPLFVRKKPITSPIIQIRY